MQRQRWSSVKRQQYVGRCRSSNGTLDQPLVDGGDSGKTLGGMHVEEEGTVAARYYSRPAESNNK
jgi:hypothetical protein